MKSKKSDSYFVEYLYDLFFTLIQQEQLLGSLDNFEPELPDTEDDEVTIFLFLNNYCYCFY